MATIVRACIIRFPDAGPVLLDDAGHTPIGVFGAVSIDTAGWLVIDTEDVREIGATVVQPDETLAARGVQCGPRTGAFSTSIRFTRNGVPLDLNNPADWAHVKGNLSNIYVLWISSTPPV